MQNPFPYSDNNKRYHTLNYALRQRFGEKVIKVSLNAGFSCPNLDGTKGNGGCTYCSSLGSGEFGGNPSEPLSVQFESTKTVLHKKWPKAQYIAYFQAHTNTYAPLEQLRACYDQALSFEQVVGLSIATRADCISPAIADLLAKYHARTFLTVELGLQSTYDATGERINRCHSYADFLNGLTLLQQRGIRTCVHLINGLPGETPAMMVENARRVGALGIDEIKLHLLHVLKGTAIAQELEQKAFHLLTQDEYTSIICNQLEVLPKEMVVQRLTGDGDRRQLIGPLWSLSKLPVLNGIDKELLLRNSYQGKGLE